MILERILSAYLGMFQTLFDALPSVDTSGLHSSGIVASVGVYKAMNDVLPVDVTMALLVLGLGYYGASYAYYGILFIYRHIPFVGGG